MNFSNKIFTKYENKHDFFLARLRREQSLWFHKEYLGNMNNIRGFTKTGLFFSTKKMRILSTKKVRILRFEKMRNPKTEKKGLIATAQIGRPNNINQLQPRRSLDVDNRHLSVHISTSHWGKHFEISAKITIFECCFFLNILCFFCKCH